MKDNYLYSNVIADNNNELVQIDDHERRIKETTLSIIEEELPLSKLRIRALEHAKKCL